MLNITNEAIHSLSFTYIYTSTIIPDVALTLHQLLCFRSLFSFILFFHHIFLHFLIHSHACSQDRDEDRRNRNYNSQKNCKSRKIIGQCLLWETRPSMFLHKKKRSWHTIPTVTRWSNRRWNWPRQLLYVHLRRPQAKIFVFLFFKFNGKFQLKACI